MSMPIAHRLEHLPEVFRKLGRALYDLEVEDEGGDVMTKLLCGFSQHERRSLRTFLDEILGSDYSDADLNLLWSRMSEVLADRCFVEDARGFFRAVRDALDEPRPQL